MIDENQLERNTRQLVTLGEMVNQKLASQNSIQMVTLGGLVEQKLMDHSAHLDQKLVDHNARQVASIGEMIDQNGISSLEKLREEIECPNCWDMFKEPKTLNCGHTFCGGCISEPILQILNQSSIKCPKCRSITNTTPELLKTSFTIKGLISLIKEMEIVERHQPKVRLPSILCRSGNDSEVETKTFVYVNESKKNIDWATVLNENPDLWSKSPQNFVAVAFATNGELWKDAKFVEYFAGMKATGIINRGAMHEFYGPCTVEQHFENFTGQLIKAGFVRGQDLAVIGLWFASFICSNEKANHFVKLIRKVDKWNDLKTIIWTWSSAWRECVGYFTNAEKDFIGEHPLWILDYEEGKINPVVPEPWTDWAMWQYTYVKKVIGITGNVWMNRLKVCL